MEDLPRLNHDDYTVAIICPMGVELTPVRAMLHAEHQSLPSSREHNAYKLEQIGKHNVVLATQHDIGIQSAATVAAQLLNDFKSIRFGLLVGIGGGIPDEDYDDEELEDIRLGDIVVSMPTGQFGGVVQFDRGKTSADGQFVQTGSLNKPPTVLAINLETLRSEHQMHGNKIDQHIKEMLEKFPRLVEDYACRGPEHDLLFQPDYTHPAGKKSCRYCDSSKLVDRFDRKPPGTKIHYGTIGSSSKVIKDSQTRDQLRKNLGILCVEMEAAGLMDTFPCLVIRGICDYADSHKNKKWQPYAAAVAAAYAKELLEQIEPAEIHQTRTMVEAMGHLSAEVARNREVTNRIERTVHSK